MKDELNWSYNGGGYAYLLKVLLSNSTIQYEKIDTDGDVVNMEWSDNKIFDVGSNTVEWFGAVFMWKVVNLTCNIKNNRMYAHICVHSKRKPFGYLKN